jgi:hypothetical protein
LTAVLLVWNVASMGGEPRGRGTGDAGRGNIAPRRAAATKGIWISPAQVAALPARGQAWNALLAAANTPIGRPHLADQNDPTDVLTLAKALVGVRTGQRAYLEQARANIMAAIGTERGGETLALGRNLAPYVIAADLVGLSPAQDAEFRTWLRSTLTERLAGRTLRSTHEDRPNNWGTMAGASRAAVAAYLGDQAELARTAQVFKGWLGDRNAYAGFKYGDLSWQADPLAPVGINPRGAIKEGHAIDGALPEEMRRGGTFQWPPLFTGYTWESLQGAVTQAEILHRAGYDAWQWQDRALLRAVQFLYGIGWKPVGDDAWIPWLIDARYGTHYATDPRAAPGKVMGWTAWTR